MLQLPAWRAPLQMILAVLAGLACFPPAAAQTSPQRVVSLNLCTDQLLLALADRGQILSLSPLVRDRSISFLWAEAAGLPINGGSGEAILFSGADLVLSGGHDSAIKQELLQRQGLDVMVLGPWHSLDEGREQVRTLARRLGHPERGDRLIARIDGALAASRAIVPRERGILTYYRRGWVPGSGSLISELLQHTGFSLHQERLGVPAGGVVRLESIVAEPPAYALMDEADGRSGDHGSALLVHPALLEAIPPERRLVIPGELTICGGPSTPAAIAALAAEVRAKVR